MPRGKLITPVKFKEIKEYIENHQYDVRKDIADHFNISTTSVSRITHSKNYDYYIKTYRPDPRGARILDKVTYQEIKSMIDSRQFLASDIIKTYSISVWTFGNIASSKDYNDYLKKPTGQIAKQTKTTPKTSAKPQQPAKPEPVEKPTEPTQEERTLNINITIPMKDIKKAKGGMLLELKNLLLGE